MSTEQSGFYTINGRLRGSYVYLLVCQQGERIYVKAGLSDNPQRRVAEIAGACAIPPDLLCTFPLPCRKTAQKAERALQSAFSKWRSHGEWFQLTVADKAEFNAAWQSALTRFGKPGWPARWDKMSVKPFLHQLEQRKRAKQRAWARGGLAYRDFVRLNRK